MTVIYTFPTESYEPEELPESDLDDIEILGPLDELEKDVSATASFQVVVNGEKLTNIAACITMTRMQDITGGLPSDSTWQFTALPSVPPKYHARWGCTSSTFEVTQGNSQAFSVPFTPTTAGQYRFTFSVEADELADTVETFIDVTVAP